MTDCCLSPRPEGMTAHTARCLLGTTAANVAHLRTLLDHRGAQETSEPEQGAEA